MYITLITDGKIKSFKAEILGLKVDQNKFARLWNSEARFVVAETNEFPIPQHTDILDYFSKHRIYNCITISQDHYVTD
jgi:hypothetical protein